MTYRIKVPPRTLPVGEEQLVSGLEHWLINLRDYRGSLIAGFVLLLLMGMGAWGLFWYEEQNASKAQELEREATLRLSNRPSNDPQKIANNLKEALALYKRVLDEYPRTPTAPLVQFSLGNAYLQSNDVDSAIDAYQRFTSTYASNTSLLGLVYQKLGYAYLLKKDLDQAAKAYSSIIDMPGAMNRDYALFEVARLEENRSKPDEALKHYQELIKTYPNSPLTSEASVRMKVIEARKNPEPSPSAAAPVAVAPSKPSKP
jgi:tetratricopeptide (TPR) repeat protein